jgi:hypothetical protein
MSRRTPITGALGGLGVVAVGAAAVAASGALGPEPSEFRDVPQFQVGIAKTVVAGQPNELLVRTAEADLAGADYRVRLHLAPGQAPVVLGTGTVSSEPTRSPSGEPVYTGSLDFTVPARADQRTTLSVELGGATLEPVPLRPAIPHEGADSPVKDPVLIRFSQRPQPGKTTRVRLTTQSGDVGKLVSVRVRSAKNRGAVKIAEKRIAAAPNAPARAQQAAGPGADPATGGQSELAVRLPADLADGAELILSVGGRTLRPIPIDLAPPGRERAGPPRASRVTVELSRPPVAGRSNTVRVRAFDGSARGATVVVSVAPQAGTDPEELGRGVLARRGGAATPHEVESTVAVTLPPGLDEGAELRVRVGERALPPVPLVLGP